MKNKIRLDHILVAVSDQEFEHYKKLSFINDVINYKYSTEWEVCYIGLAKSLYLEIVKKSKYPTTIGLALSSLGEEKLLLNDLNSHYREWEFNLEKKCKNNLHWYDGYFSEQTENENVFLWFMEYFNKFKSERRHLFSQNILNQVPVINLSKVELSDLMSVIEYVPLKIKSNKDGITFRDFENRSFRVKVSDVIDSRLLINF